VLLDVMMPGMSGFEVCRELKRRHADGPFLPVILLTGLSEQSDRTEGLRAGADDFVSKPCDRTELVLRVQAFLRTRRQDLVIRRQLDDLRELEALKDDLVSLVAHDLRNPLSSLLSLLEVARAEERDPELRADLEVSLAAAARARNVAESLLETRLLEERRVPVRRTRTSVEALTREVLRAFEIAEPQRRVTFKMKVEGDPVAAVDASLVSRAVENLLSNAVRHSPQGGEVAVTIRRVGSALELEVADRGPGLAPDVRTTAFEKFGGVATYAHGARRGYGLGLYSVKLVAQAHGGSVSVHERAGGGAVFRIRIEGPDAAP
jgi:signal transduction histidine kinase